jgi:hypothetical protein
MAKFKNGATYHEGNDNLNEHQFTQGKNGDPSDMKYHSLKKSPNKTEVRNTTQQHRGEKGGKWKKKPRRKDKLHG